MASVQSKPGDNQRQSTTEIEPESSEASMRITAERALLALERGTVHERGLLPYSSNHSFLVVVSDSGSDGDLALPAVYKPQRGESPLWDFEWGTLCKRERAAWLTSHALGWDLIPPTVLRSATRGLGSVQFYVDHEEEEHYFTVQQDARFADAFRRLALFDYITNNADRKSGHCLVGVDGRLWAIDHGLCFNHEFKLRTVIWEFADEPIEPELQRDLEMLLAEIEDAFDLAPMNGTLNAPAANIHFFDEEIGTTSDDDNAVADDVAKQSLADELSTLLSISERHAFVDRIRTLLRAGCYPAPDPYRRNFPWPPV